MQRTLGRSEPPLRRRNSVLSQALFRAALDELAESGPSGVTFERVAHRAAAARTSLYRRWRTPDELLADAVSWSAPVIRGFLPPISGELRLDLVRALSAFAARLDEPVGHALRPALTDRTAYPALFAAVQERVVAPWLEHFRTLLSETAPPARVVGLGVRLVVSEHIENGPVAKVDIEAIVDEILLPLVRGPR